MRYGRVAITVLLILGIGIFASILVRSAVGDPPDVYQQGFQLVRETATEDAADFATTYALATAEGDFAGKDSLSVLLGGPFRLKSQRSDLGQYQSIGTRWQFIICGGLAENDTFSYSLVGWAADNGPLQVICEGTGIIGTQDVVLYPDDNATATDIWWADTIVVTATTKWTKAEGGANGVSAFNAGANQIAVLQLYPQGLEWIQFVFHACDGSGTEASNLTVYGRRI